MHKCKAKRLLLVLALILPLLSSCGEGIKDIRVNSLELVSVTPQGLTELDVLVRVGLHNPSVGFEVTDLHGVIKIQGEPVLLLDSDQLMVSPRCDKVYSIPMHGALSEGYNPFRLLNFLNNKMVLDDVSADIKVRIAMRGGIGKNLEYKDIPVSKYLKK